MAMGIPFGFEDDAMDPSMRGRIVCGVPVGHPGFMEYHLAAKKSEVIEYIDTTVARLRDQPQRRIISW